MTLESEALVKGPIVQSYGGVGGGALAAAPVVSRLGTGRHAVPGAAVVIMAAMGQPAQPLAEDPRPAGG